MEDVAEHRSMSSAASLLPGPNSRAEFYDFPVIRISDMVCRKVVSLLPSVSLSTFTCASG